MSEEWAREKIFVIVDFSPFAGGTMDRITLWGQRKSWRPQAQDVSQRRLVIAVPALGQKASLRSPTMTQRGAAIDGPPPVGSTIELVSESADFVLVGRIVIKVSCGREHAGEKKS